MPRGRDTRFDPSRQAPRERSLAEDDDYFRSQPGWAQWHGGGSYAPGDPTSPDSYEYFANMGEAESAMHDRSYGRGPNGLGTPAVDESQEMHWHLGSEPWNSSDPYPDARIYQNPSGKDAKVDEGPSFGWERT